MKKIMQLSLLYVAGAIIIVVCGLIFLAMVLVMVGTLLGNLAIWPIIGAALIGYRHDNITVGIKTWAELIEENKARLQFFKEHLQHRADESAALRFLQEKHSKFLEGVIVKDDDEAEDNKSE